MEYPYLGSGANGLGPRGGVVAAEVPKSSQVVDALCNLETAVATLEGELGDLHARLSPILQPSSGDKSAQSAPTPAVVPLAQRIAESTYRVRMATLHVNALRMELEL